MKLVLRVDDVGRQPQDSPENGTDTDLTYFFRWRETLGLKGLPVYYGVVPTWISNEALERLEIELSGEERVAIHGWDHVGHKPPGLVEMKEALRRFSSLNPTAYIPPFNKYDASTLKNWKQAGGLHFFGGFPEEHYPGTGSFPTVQHGLLYLPAYKPYYGHAWEVAKALTERREREFPLVMTFHVPWDSEADWGVLRDVIGKIFNQLVTLQNVLIGAPYGN